MQLSPDLLRQLARDRHHDLRASAAARRLAGHVPARRRIAQSSRHAADRLDAASVPATGPVSASPGALARG